MRVLFTGSQLWTDKELVFDELDHVLEELCWDVEQDYIFTLVHGHCPNGADAFADEWGVLRKSQGFPVKIERHRADWKGPRKRGAGYARNAEMVKLGADSCLAFILNESPGATHCSSLAEKAGIETQVFRSTTMVHKRVTEDLKLENIRPMWRNFAGEKRLYNESGKRIFSIPLDEPLALELREIGWNIRDNSKKVKEDPNKELLYHLDVTVKMDGKRPPRIFMITKSQNRRTQLDEDTLVLLDYAEFDLVDVIIRPFNWDVQGKQGVAAYLKTGFFTIHEDDLEKKYSHVPIDNAAAPLEIENVIDVESEWVDEGIATDEEYERQKAQTRGSS